MNHDGPTRFEVVVDDGGFDFIEVAQRADNLHDDGACLFLRHQLVLFQVEVQVIPFTEFQHCAESDRDRCARLHTEDTNANGKKLNKQDMISLLILK